MEGDEGWPPFNQCGAQGADCTLIGPLHALSPQEGSCAAKGCVSRKPEL